jgi:hypothetical protein
MKFAAHHITFAILGVSFSADSFAVAESSLIRMTFCAEKPTYCKSENHYRYLYETIH